MDALSFQDFDTAARAALAFLHTRLGFDLWMVTRKLGDDWMVLQSEDHGVGVKNGAVFRWADSFCARMVEGLGPRVAPRSSDVMAYASAPLGQQLGIGAYVGVPLTSGDGTIFGTLCAMDRAAQPESITEQLDLVELVAALLSTLLRTETQLVDESRRAERAQTEALVDPLTALYNRRGWMRLLGAEENRCRRYGHPACVMAMDLDDLKEINDTRGHFAGDELLVRAGAVLAGLARSQDVAARVGGDEFMLLAVECDRAGAAALEARLRARFLAADVRMSIGTAMRDPARTLQDTWEEADRAMYAEKTRS